MTLQNLQSFWIHSLLSKPKENGIQVRLFLYNFVVIIINSLNYSQNWGILVFPQLIGRGF